MLGRGEQWSEWILVLCPIQTHPAFNSYRLLLSPFQHSTKRRTKQYKWNRDGTVNSIEPLKHYTHTHTDKICFYLLKIIFIIIILFQWPFFFTIAQTDSFSFKTRSNRIEYKIIYIISITKQKEESERYSCSRFIQKCFQTELMTTPSY